MKDWDTIKRLFNNLVYIEHRDDLSSDEKASHIITIVAVIAAAVAVQPIPGPDTLILTPLDIWLAYKLSLIRSVKFAPIEVVYVIFLGLLAQQFAIGVWKLITFPAFILAWMVTIPLVFFLTKIIGKIIDWYFKNKSKNGGDPIPTHKLKEFLDKHKPKK